MAYMQVKEILASARNMRRFMHEYLQRHERKSPDGEAEGLYTEMRRHEDLLRQCLSDYADEATEGQAETWIQFPNEESLERVMDQLSSDDEQNEEVVLQRILDAEEELLSTYEIVISQTHAPQVRELIEQLITLEDHYLRTIASGVSELGQQRRPPTSEG